MSVGDVKFVREAMCNTDYMMLGAKLRIEKKPPSKQQDKNGRRGILRKVVACVLQELLQKLAEDQLPESQYGFRKGRGCVLINFSQ